MKTVVFLHAFVIESSVDLSFFSQFFDQQFLFLLLLIPSILFEHYRLQLLFQQCKIISLGFDTLLFYYLA